MKQFLFLSGLILVGGQSFAQSPITSWNMMHTRPECNNPNNPNSVKKPTWCEVTESKKAAELSGMEAEVKRLIALASDKTKASITIAYFSFSNRAAFEALCERGKAGIPIRGFFDKDYQADPTSFPNRLQKECQSGQSKNVHISFLGEKSTTPGSFVWRLHHNKFLIVNPGDGSDISLNFSSGNLSSSGLSIHLDHWVMLKVRPDSNMYLQHQCVINALDKAITDSSGADAATDDPDAYRSTLNACLKKPGMINNVEDAVAKEQIAPLFAPDPKNGVYAALSAQIRQVQSGGRIYGAIQHFLHSGIALDLRRAKENGVTVNLIMDDDVITGDSEVPGVKAFYDQQLKPYLNIQFMQTNSGARQMMHNKYIILEGLKGNRTRVFSGAGHFTNSAMKNNYENFYVSENSTLTGLYKDMFQYMQKNAISEAEIKP